jgi:hypothetical protein
MDEHERLRQAINEQIVALDREVLGLLEDTRNAIEATRERFHALMNEINERHELHHELEKEDGQ